MDPLPDIPLLEIRGLTVQFPSSQGLLTVVDDVSFSVGRNEVVCVVGESGSGKSVTMQAAVGLVQTKGGKVSGIYAVMHYLEAGAPDGTGWK